MPHTKPRHRAGPASSELMTPSHPPARKVAGQRSRSPSPKRRPLSNMMPGLQLGNFAKLFASLNHPGPQGLQNAATPATTSESSPRTTPTLASNIPTGGVTAELVDQLSSCNITPTPNRTIGETRKPGPLRHVRQTSGSPPAIKAPSSHQGNAFAVLQNADPEMVDPDLMLTPPVSEDEADPVFEQSDRFSPISSATTPCCSEQKSDDTPRLGNRLAALAGLTPLSFASKPQVLIRQDHLNSTATTAVEHPSTPTAARVVEARPAPSSENGQRLFNLYTSPPKPTSSFTKFTQRVAETFSPYDDRTEKKYFSQLADGTHVFIDWSNFFVGCRSTVRDLRRLGPREKLRFSLNFERVKFLLERQRLIRSRHLAGSRGKHKFANDQLDAIKMKGYDVMCPQRIPTALHHGWSDYDSYTSDCSASESDHSRKAVWDKANSWDEQCVDELLQLKMAKEIIHSTNRKRTGVMVLATGDANDAEFSKGGFLGMVTNALESGWCVELYSFTSSFSSAWSDPAFAAQWGHRFTYHLLDDFAEFLVEQDC